MLVSRFLQIDGPDTGLSDEIHIVRVDFQDFIHPVHRENDAAINRNCLTADVCCASTECNGNQIGIGQFYDFRYLFRRFRKNNYFRLVKPYRIPFFIGLI